MNKILMSLLLFIIAPVAAFAQEQTQTDDETKITVPNGTTFKDWTILCEAATTTTVSCTLLQRLTRSDDDSLLLSLVILPVAKKDSYLMIAQTPVGVSLAGGLAYRVAGVDEFEQREMLWQRCSAKFCEAAINLDSAEIENFIKYDELLFGYKPSLNGESVVFAVDISEFDQAIAALAASEPEG